jgi:hypothetical protein
MPNMTLALPQELHEFVKKHNEVNWSEISRRAMQDHAKRITLLEKLDKLAEKSSLTEEDIRILDKKIKKGMWQRLMDETGHRYEPDHGSTHQRRSKPKDTL